ncbi:hypothetical protein KJ693_09625 [bacterium]|nr:hypothetical protein [bacterium]MBU1615552.1 hypothetical protein [bacterium]
MVVSKDNFCKALIHLGFEEEKGKDHLYFKFIHKGKVVARTKVSRGKPKDIKKNLLGHILRSQIFLTKKQLNLAIAGKLGGNEYGCILKEKEII